MSKIVQLKKEGINEYPITIPEAVIDSNGVTVKDKLKTLEDKIENIKPGSDPYDDTEIKKQLNNKIEKGSLATINGQNIEQGGNIKIEGGSSVTPDWQAREGEEGYIENKPFGKEVLDEGFFDEEGQCSTYFDVPLNKVACFIDDIEYTDLTLGDFTNGEWPVEFIFDKNEGYQLVYTGSGAEEERFGYEIVCLKLLDELFIPDTIARKSDLDNSGGGKSKFQLYRENGGSFFSNENVYNIFDALRNESSNYYTDLIIDEVLETDRYYSFSELGINYRDLLGIIYNERGVEIHLGQDDYSSLYTPGEGNDMDMYFENEAFHMIINIVEQTLILDTHLT